MSTPDDAALRADARAKVLEVIDMYVLIHITEPVVAQSYTHGTAFRTHGRKGGIECPTWLL